MISHFMTLQYYRRGHIIITNFIKQIFSVALKQNGGLLVLSKETHLL